nr:DUF2127 domain-containing protein [Rhabdothermincola salaria]
MPRRWDAEALTCAIRGHVAPGARARIVTDDDHDLAVDAPDGARLSRCLRCDNWLRSEPPTSASATWDRLPPLDALPRPRRGKALDDAIITRFIAIERFGHFVVFTLLAVALALVDTDLGGLRADARSMADGLTDAVAGSSRGGAHSWAAERLEELASLQGDTVRVLLVASALFAVMEGTEAIGLWLEKRWAEYLTVVATAIFLPLEVRELVEGVSAVKVATLTVNLLVLAYLIWAKRLFGLRGGRSAGEATVDWAAVLDAPPPTPDQLGSRRRS